MNFCNYLFNITMQWSTDTDISNSFIIIWKCLSIISVLGTYKGYPIQSTFITVTNSLLLEM